MTDLRLYYLLWAGILLVFSFSLVIGGIPDAGIRGTVLGTLIGALGTAVVAAVSQLNENQRAKSRFQHERDSADRAAKLNVASELTGESAEFIELLINTILPDNEIEPVRKSWERVSNLYAKCELILNRESVDSARRFHFSCLEWYSQIYPRKLVMDLYVAKMRTGTAMPKDIAEARKNGDELKVLADKFRPKAEATRNSMVNAFRTELKSRPSL